MVEILEPTLCEISESEFPVRGPACYILSAGQSDIYGFVDPVKESVMIHDEYTLSQIGLFSEQYERRDLNDGFLIDYIRHEHRCLGFLGSLKSFLNDRLYDG